MQSYSYDKTITQLFEKAVMNFPDNIAFYLDSGHINYRKFNEEVNQYAHYLREQGVSRNIIVAVEMVRSYEMFQAIFAIIKAGGIYLPISPDYPKKRKMQIIKDAKVNFLIVDLNHSHYTNDSCRLLKLSDITKESYSKENLLSINEPNDIAYVIYTSGSTGSPKGAMIAHHSLINRIEWMQKMFPIGTKDILFQKTHCGFDVSIWEIFWWSITGAGVALLPHGREDDILLMLKMIVEKRITVIHFVPTILRIFLEYFEVKKNVLTLDSLRFVFSSGETLDANTVNYFHQLFSSTEYPILINLYGPTEATIDVTYFVCDKKVKYDEIPIGKAIQNTELIVLDNSFTPVASGQTGELYLSGVCLAKGYLNNSEKTDQCFLKAPFDPSKVIYKTGDFVKWNNANELCYIGRKDQQVKINGIRIELGEIEHYLRRFKNIVQAVVLCIDFDSTLKRLAAFLRLENQSESIDILKLNAFLRNQISHPIFPQDYFIVENYPLMPNGKIDRKKLLNNIYLDLFK